MYVYKHVEKNFLLLTPFLCGSSFIKHNRTNLGLKFINDIEPFQRKTVVREQDLIRDLIKTYFPYYKKKYVLFRDPFQRVLSYFSKFVYTQTYNISNIHNYNTHNLKEVSVDFWNNFEDWFFNIEENIDDMHMNPISKQLEFLELLDRANELTFVPIKNYSTWMTETFDFDMKHYTPSLSYFNLNLELLPQILTIRDYIKEIYREDYILLKRITLEWKNLYRASNLPFIVQNNDKINKNNTEK